MSQIIKAVSPETLRSWGVSPDAQINYYDGKVLVIDDGTEDVGIGTMAKFGCSLIFGVAVFTHAPLVGVTMFAYSAYKVLSTVGSMYGGNHDLASRIERDLGLDTPALPAASNDFENRFEDAVATYQPGNHTRLGAVEVAASPAAQTSSPTALSIIVSDPYQSRAFFGAQRTGKSYLAAVASRQISEALRCKVYHINLASFGDEDSYYWSHAVKSLTCDLSSLGGYEASQMIRSAIEIVKKFYSTQNAILIVDEIAYCGSSVAAHKDALAELMRVIADKITTLSSSGKKRMQAIWTIAPEFVAGSLTQDAKAVKKLKLCYVSVNPDASIDWQGQTIGFDWELFNQIKANYTISDPICVPSQDRICFIGSDWVPVGELPDLKKGKSTKLETPISDPVTHLENSLKASDDADDDVFSKFAATLTHESQANLKSFVLWLGKKQGSEVSFKQIQDSWAKNNNVARSKETLMPLIYAAKSKQLLTLLSNSNWRVCGR